MARPQPIEPTSAFWESLAGFMSKAQAITDQHMERYPTQSSPTLTRKEGGRYVKIIRDGGTANTSVHCFVDKSNGDVLMAAGWKAPAKHARGNIFDAENGAKFMGPYGPAYLK